MTDWNIIWGIGLCYELEFFSIDYWWRRLLCLLLIHPPLATKRLLPRFTDFRVLAHSLVCSGHRGRILSTDAPQRWATKWCRRNVEFINHQAEMTSDIFANFSKEINTDTTCRCDKIASGGGDPMMNDFLLLCEWWIKPSEVEGGSAPTGIVGNKVLGPDMCSLTEGWIIGLDSKIHSWTSCYQRRSTLANVSFFSSFFRPPSLAASQTMSIFIASSCPLELVVQETTQTDTFEKCKQDEI